MAGNLSILSKAFQNNRHNNHLILEDLEQSLDFLNKWVNIFLEIEQRFVILPKINNLSRSKEYYDFLELIGQSVYLLNLFNSKLINAFDRKVESKQYVDYAIVSQYLRFNNNLVTSKIKHFFFREVPYKSYNEPFVKVDLDVFLNAKGAIESLKTNNFSDFKFYISKYFHLLGFLYSFIYNPFKNEGVFLRFNYNKDIFNGIYNMIMTNISKLNDSGENEISFREFAHNLIPDILKSYLDNTSKSIASREVYQVFVGHFYQNDALFVEPLTWRFADLIWKTEGAIQDMDEITTSGKKTELDKEIISNVTRFIGNYLNECKKMYQNKKINYESLFDFESQLVSVIWEKILYQKKRENIRLFFDEITLIAANQPEINVINFKPNKEVEILNKLRREHESYYKIERLIEDLDRDELISLLISYFGMFNKSIVQNKRTAFVGFYTSGVFLAHLLNILFKLEKPVWMFKTFPYVSTHPIHSESDNLDFDTILICDESIKTGFTYSIYEGYLFRNCNKEVKTILYALFDFSYYKKLDTKQKNFNALVELNENFSPFKSSIIVEMDKTIAIKKIDIEKIIDSATRDEGLDVTLIMTNSQVLFFICDRFKFIIKEMMTDKNKDSVLLFSPSPEGRVLALITSLLIKLDGGKVIFSSKSNASYLNVAIDISIDTGFTLAYESRMHQNASFRKEDIRSYLNTFDKILTIMYRENGNLKVSEELLLNE